MWHRYERELPQAIDTLVSGKPIPSNYVLEILVPFVAGLCVRSSMYDDWLAKEHGEDVTSHPDLTNLTRVALMNGLAGRIMRCEWIVVHADRGARFITNDLGFTGGETPDGTSFMFVPLRPDAGLQLRRTGRPMWRRLPGGRCALIGRLDGNRADVSLVNQELASRAKREIYGREASDIASVCLHAEPDGSSFFAGALLNYAIEDWRNPPDREWIDEMKRAELHPRDALLLPEFLNRHP